MKKYLPPVYVPFILVIWIVATILTWTTGWTLVKAALFQAGVITVCIIWLFLMFKMFTLMDKYEEWRKK